MNIEDVIMNSKHNIMNAKYVKEQLYHGVPLQVLSYISVQHGTIFSADEIQRAIKISKGSTNQALRLLGELDMVTREKKGNLYIYRVNPDNFILRQFKIFENTIFLNEMVSAIKKYCREIILFGSCAIGTNALESDMDIFIRTEYKDIVLKAAHRFETEMPLKPIIMDSLEFAELKEKDSVFYGQIMKGITLWKGSPENGKY
jgi:predicted nucleotidyltransferase